MAERLVPADALEVQAAVEHAVASGATLEILGQGSKRALGRPVEATATLDLSRLTGITLYEPGELVLSARAGAAIADIEAVLSAQNQELAFEPMDYGPLLGLPRGKGTIGGVLATNLSGPRRVKAGAARDHILGVAAVSGRGEAFKAGGRVVKNVTGYDLSRGLAGSWGTLAVFTDVTFKVLPRAETETTLALLGLDDRGAAGALATAMASPAELSGAAHLPKATAANLGYDSAITLMRIEGIAPSVAYRFERLAGILKTTAPCERFDAAQSRTIWSAVRYVTPLAEPRDRQVWRLSIPPASGPDCVAALALQGLADGVLYDWNCGLIWLALPPADDANAASIRAAVLNHGGGHATLVRAAAEVRARIPVFQPQPGALGALTERLRRQFDPSGVLNPGRMAPG